jgi:aspartyl-tRNA(Asn)/glutamyl-tRNA(Gln) amidotransferase subunit C
MANSPEINIDYVAKLARIELTAEEKEKYSQQLGQILGYFQKLSEIDVSNVEPSAHAHAIYNVWREDIEGTPMNVDDALMNAPAKRDNQIVVPKVVDDA